MTEPTVKENWGYSCPKCADDTELSVTYKSEAKLSSDGTDDNEGCNDHAWDGDSPMRCGACDWEGRVSQAEEQNKCLSQRQT